jgi:hypothetical protein
MARQFQPPNIPQQPSREEALLNPIGQAIQTLPMQWMKYKMDRRQMAIQDKELALKERGVDIEDYKAKNPPQYVAPSIDPTTGLPTFTPYPTGTRPGPASPAPTPILSPEGKQVGTTFGRPTVLPKPDASTTKDVAAAAEMEAVVGQAIQELERIEPLNKESRGGLFGRIAQRTESALDPDKPSKKFTNTADVINTLQGMVSRVLKSTFGAQLSDGERQYLNEVYGASEKMSRKEREIAIKNVKTILNDKLVAAKSRAGGAPTEAQADVDPLGIR